MTENCNVCMMDILYEKEGSVPRVCNCLTDFFSVCVSNIFTRQFLYPKLGWPGSYEILLYTYERDREKTGNDRDP